MITTLHDRNLRNACNRRGLILRKARATKYPCPDIGDGYQILSGYNGNILIGDRFELSLEDVRDWLNAYDKETLKQFK